MTKYLIIDHDIFGYTQSRAFDDMMEAVEYCMSFSESRLIETVELYEYDDVIGYHMIKRYKIKQYKKDVWTWRNMEGEA